MSDTETTKEVENKAPEEETHHEPEHEETDKPETEAAAPAEEETTAAAAAEPEPEAPAKEPVVKQDKSAEAQQDKTQYINLKVVGQDGSEVFFKIKKHTSLKKLVEAYCSRQGISSTAIRFLYDGHRIHPDQTPKDLNMEDGDIIDAMLQQTGGF